MTDFLDLLPTRKKPSAFQSAIQGFVDDLVATSKETQDVDPRYRTDIMAWWTERFGMPAWTLKWSILDAYKGHMWDGTPDPILAIAQAIVDGKDVGVESATGTGKTFLAAVLAYWWIDVWENGEVILIAPREKQLRINAWKEITRLFPRFQQLRPKARILDLELRVEPDNPKHKGWGIIGFGAQVKAGEESATSVQGSHAPHQLWLLEETPGIHPAILMAIENTLTGDHNIRLALGNPDSHADALHQFCIQDGVTHVRISGLDHPNVVCDDSLLIQGAVSTKSVERRASKFGRGSRLFKSRVRGICPSESTESLIRWSWCQAAASRAVEERDTLIRMGPTAMGVDVANSINGDRAAIALGLGSLLEYVEAFQCEDANELGGLKVKPLMDLYHMHPKNVGVDTVGVGVGTWNELKRLGRRVASLKGGESMVDVGQEETFNNLRSQMYWQFAMDLQHGRIGIPDDQELWEELTIPTYKTNGKEVIVESKEDLKKRLGRSPDKADAAVYWNWVRQARHGATTGGSVVTM